MNKYYPKTPSEVWNEIKGKAHLYKTALWNGKFVQIIKVTSDGTFLIYSSVFGECMVNAYEMTDYCL